MALKKDAATPWSYRKGKGILYKVPAGIKLVVFLCLSIAIFIFNIYFLPFAVFAIIIFASLSGIRPWELLKGSYPLIFLASIITLFQSVELQPVGFNRAGCITGVILGLRMLVSFSACALLFSVTTMNEILKTLSKTEKFFHLEKTGISLGIALMLAFIPMFFEIWENVSLAWKSRGGRNNQGKIIKLIPIVLNKLIEKAAETSIAMESRGFLQ